MFRPDLRAHPNAISFTDHDDQETILTDVKHAAETAKNKIDRLCPKSKVKKKNSFSTIVHFYF